MADLCASVSALLSVLKEGKTVESRVDAAKVLGAILLSSDSDPISSIAGIECLAAICGVRRANLRMVKEGIVPAAAKVLKADVALAPASTAEKAIIVLEAASGNAEGRSAICEAAEESLGAVLGRMMKVGREGREAAAALLWIVCYRFRDRRATTSATLLDNGNLVIYHSSIPGKTQVLLDPNVGTSPGNAAKPGSAYTRRACSEIYRCKAGSRSDDIVMWRSFDLPTDTILGGQSLRCGHNLTSSAGENDHALGKDVLHLPCGGGNLISYRLNSADKNWEVGSSGDDFSSLNLDVNGRLFLTSSGGNEKELSGYKPRITPDGMLYRTTFDATFDADKIFVSTR